MSNLSKKELELEHCLSVLACVITHHGTSFWPLYLLVEEELKSIQHRRDKLANSLSRIPNAVYPRNFEQVL